MSTAHRILILGGNNAALQTTVRTLVAAGYEVNEASDTDTALALLREQSPQLVLLDVDLPDPPPLDLLQRIKADAAESLPVMLLCSEKTAPELLDAALDAGADAYITRSDSHQELLLRVRTQLRQRKLRDDLRASEASLAHAQRITHLGSWELDIATGGLLCSDETYRICAVDSEVIGGYCDAFFDAVHSGDKEVLQQSLQRALAGEEPLDIEHRILRPDGTVRWVHELGELIHDGLGRAISLRGTIQDVTPRKRNELIHEWEAQVLESISAGAPLGAVLEQIARGVEDITPGAIASILLVDDKHKQLRHGAAPSLPQSYIKAIDGIAIGPASAVCGTAAHRRELVIVSDIESDPLVADYRDLAREHGLKACWSIPVLDAAGKVLATFALYHNYPHTPEPNDLRLIRRTASILKILLERDNRARELRLLEACMSRLSDIILITEAEPLNEPGPRILFVNEAFEKRSGYTKAEAIGNTPRMLQGPKTRRDALDRIRTALEQHQPVREELINYSKSGEEFWLEVDIVPVSDSSGEITHFVSIERDITERKRIEMEVAKHSDELRLANQQLAESQALLRMATHLGRLGGWAVDLREGSLFWSDEVRNIHEVPADYTPTGDEAVSFYVPEHVGLIREAVKICARDATPFDLELKIISAKGNLVWVRSIGEAVRDSSGCIVRVEGAFQDITQRKNSEQSLRESEERFQLLSKATNDAIWDWNLATDAMWWNEGFETLFGFRRDKVEPTFESWSSRIHPDEREQVMTDIHAVIDSGGEKWSAGYGFLRSDGTYARVLDRGHVIRDAAGKALRMVGGMTDISERLALEDQLRQAQRLESVGQLTGGIAHDFNNLLTVIMGNAELLAEDPGLGAVCRRYAGLIAGAAQRGADLTQRLLAFARKQPLDSRAVDVNQLAAGMDDLLRRALGEQIEIEFTRTTGLWPALVDPSLLESALLNLAINARDAMPAGGRLTIETQNMHITEDYAAQHLDVMPGQYVLVAVSDSGEGIAPENLVRIFEPFFTTKEKGKGTGLGLPMVYGFVKQSGGHITVYSEPGYGTTVKLYLPRAEGETGRISAGTAARETAIIGGSENILLVEDDDLVRRYASSQLVSLGYRVVEAVNGREALEILRLRDDFDLLFTDVIMPGGMSGRQLAEEATKLHPAMSVLYTSGYTEDAIVHQGRLDPGVLLLAKPYHRADLASKVRIALDKSGV